MEMIIVPRYEDLFEGPLPAVETLLEGIPSNAVLYILATINAELLLSENKPESQIKILQEFLRRNPPIIQAEIILKARLKAKDNQGFPLLFATNYILAFMHYELRHFRHVSIEDTTPEQELRIFKAYFCFVTLGNASAGKVYDEAKNIEATHFYKYSWPLLVDQLDANGVVNPMTEMVRGMAFFNFLQYHSPYASAVQTFLRKKKQESAWSYTLQMLEIFQHTWNKPKVDFWSRAMFKVTDDTAHLSLFASSVTDPEMYSLNYPLDEQVLSGLKAGPLYRYNQEIYVVLNWNFFANKLYEGLLFDFYAHSGIAEGTPFKTFPNFKQYLSEQVTEGFLFKRLLSQTLNTKHSVLTFDDKVISGFPDAYYRQGRKVILFEIKDAYFPATAIQSRSYTDIKEAIDKKFNQVHKGVGQLIRQLKFLRTNSFESPAGYSHSRNFKVYPVMIFTDSYFGIPGVNQYLDEAFRQQLRQEDLDKYYKQVQPLTLISLQFFINNLHVLQRQDIELPVLLDAYHQYLKRSTVKHERSLTLNDYFAMYEPFTQFFVKAFGNHFNQPRDYVRTITDALDLTQGLPKK